MSFNRGPTILLLVALIAGSSCAAADNPPQTIDAQEFSDKLTQLLSERTKRAPYFLKRIDQSGSAAISGIENTGCASAAYHHFKENVDLSVEFAGELRRTHTDAIRRLDEVKMVGRRPSDELLATTNKVIQDFRRLSEQVLEVVHGMQLAVAELTIFSWSKRASQLRRWARQIRPRPSETMSSGV